MLRSKIITLSLVFSLLFTTIVQPIIVTAEILEETVPQLRLSLAKPNKSEESHNITINKNEKVNLLLSGNNIKGKKVTISIPKDIKLLDSIVSDLKIKHKEEAEISFDKDKNQLGFAFKDNKLIKNLEIELGAQQPGCFELEGHVDDTSIYSSVTLRVKGQETDNSGEKESETTNTESNNSDTEENGKVDENQEKIDYSLLYRDRVEEDEITKAYQVQQYKLSYLEDPVGFMKLFRTAGTANKIFNNGINMIKIDQKHSIGMITSKEMLNTQHPFFLQGKLEITVPGISDGLLGAKPGDGVSMGVHTDEQSAVGKTGEDLGIKGISNGWFGVFDTFKNAGQITCPLVGSWSTNSKGDLVKQEEKSVERNGKTGVSAVFGPEFNLKKPTPVGYSIFYNSEQSRSLSVNYNIPDSPGYSNSYNIPENIPAVNFYTAAVSGGSTSNVDLIVENGQAIVYKSEKPVVKLLNDTPPVTKARLSLKSSRDGHPLYQTGSVVTASLYNELDKLINEEKVSLGSETDEISVPITDDTIFINISVEERYTSIDGKKRTARSSDETRVCIKEDGGTINVRYVNLDGKEIAPAENITGKYNAPYEVEPKGISGYTFVKDVANNRKGNIPKKGETVTVTLQYKEGDEKLPNNGFNNDIYICPV